MTLCVSTTRAGIASTDSDLETEIKTSLVLKNTNAHLKNFPKACKHIFREDIFRFGEDCSYRHKNDSNKDLNVEDIQEQHANEIKTLKYEMSKIKEIIVIMQNQITTLNEEIKSSKKI